MIEFEALAEAMGDLDEDVMVESLTQVMDEGGADAQKALEACQKGMDIVGKLFEDGEYFVGDLIYAGELMTKAVDILKDALVTGGDSGEKKTKMILCTVKDDLHDIGKNIVRSMLEAAGFDVMDLGIDVPAGKIVETAKKEDIHIIGLSGVLTLAIGSGQDCDWRGTGKCGGLRTDRRRRVGEQPPDHHSLLQGVGAGFSIKFCEV